MCQGLQYSVPEAVVCVGIPESLPQHQGTRFCSETEGKSAKAFSVPSYKLP